MKIKNATIKDFDTAYEYIKKLHLRGAFFLNLFLFLIRVSKHPTLDYTDC